MNYRVKSKAYRYWFFMYNLLHEYLECRVASFGCDLTDFKAVEKYFGDGEFDMSGEQTEQNSPKLRTSDVISVLKQFIESSNYGEFELRMRLLKSFELYLHQSESKGSTKKRNRIISVIHNLYTYYSQFEIKIGETIQSKRAQIEKKLKEFVKIESYNKDLSYFGMKNNIARVHRHLFKFLREFETALMEKIAQAFVWKADETHSLTDEPQSKRTKTGSEPTISSYLLDVKNFVSPNESKVTIPSNGESLLAKVDRLFGVSRNVVRNAILHAEFPSLLYNLDMNLCGQIETCNYLRALEVDRSQEKPKQKSQAKHILQQKRKAIADCFKLLATLGLSFRSGLLESSMQTDLVDLKIAPFSMQSIINASPKHLKINQTIDPFTKNIDLNFAKCVFKLKLLQMSLLTPNPELGLPNFERIKGFTVDMFLLVQLQRQTLCKSVNELQQLQENNKRITELREILTNADAHLSFNAMTLRLESIECALIRIADLIEQYKLLLNCVPNDEDKSFTAIKMPAFIRTSEKYRQMSTKLASLSKSSKILLSTVQSSIEQYFKNPTQMNTISIEFNSIVCELHTVCDALKLNDSEYLVFAKPLVELLKTLNIDRTPNEELSDVQTANEDNSVHNISNELENIVHHMLIAMQNIYKKYSSQKESEPIANDNKQSQSNESDDDQDEETIQKDHLKQKITAEINSDWQTLGLSTVTNKLTKITKEIYHSNNSNTQRIECLQKIISTIPILEQFELLCKYYLIQQLNAHKLSTKMLSVMLTVFTEMSEKGFCIPPDLMQDEDGQQNENGDGKEGEGFGLEDGTGEKDVSDK